jgi:SAM-dependent methyltransferase
VKPFAHMHGRLVHSRRVRVLAPLVAELLAPLAPGARVLDVGCGDGALASAILELRPDLGLQGVDVLVRPQARIPVTAFDGEHLPGGEAAWDAVLLVDVLHHTADPALLLREARRVARAIVLKDHLLAGWLAGPTLRLMDWVGNAGHGVSLPYNYWSEARWRAAFAELGLRTAAWQGRLQLYPGPADWLFGRGLHFLVRLEREA